MGKSKREFIMEELMEPGFIEIGGREIFLEETEKGGESLLNLHFLSGDNLCIANVDKKRTDMQFFQKDQAKSMYKRVDHMIFERQEGGCWQRIPFVHRPVPMKRDCQGILRGQVTVEAG